MTTESIAAGRQPSLVDSPYAWLRLAISVVLATTGTVGMWSVVVVLPAVQAEFGVDRAAASLPFTALMIGFAVGNVIVGRVVDRFGITLPIIGAAVTLGIGFFTAGLTTAIWQFALVEGVFIGIGTSASFGPLIANISHWFHRRRGIAVAATASGNYLSGTIWPPILQWLIDAEGWRAAYMVVGVFCIVAMVPLALLLRRDVPREDHPVLADGTASPIHRQSIPFSPRTLQIMLTCAGVACCVAMSMPQVHLVAYCADLGYGVARGAEMLSLMLAGGVFSRVASGFLADYIGGVRTLLLGSVLQCLALGLYLPFDGLASLYVISLVFGLSQGGIVPSYALIVREYLPAREAGQRVGLVIFGTVMGMALGGWLSGWIYDLTGSYEAAFLNGIAWNLVNISIMLTLLWRTREPAPVAAT
jgi:MFS family permease